MKVICSKHNTECQCIRYGNGNGYFCKNSKCKHKAFIRNRDLEDSDIVLIGIGDYIIRKEVIVHGY